MILPRGYVYHLNLILQVCKLLAIPEIDGCLAEWEPATTALKEP